MVCYNYTIRREEFICQDQDQTGEEDQEEEEAPEDIIMEDIITDHGHHGMDGIAMAQDAAVVFLVLFL